MSWLQFPAANIAGPVVAFHWVQLACCWRPRLAVMETDLLFQPLFTYVVCQHLGRQSDFSAYNLLQRHHALLFFLRELAWQRDSIRKAPGTAQPCI